MTKKKKIFAPATKEDLVELGQAMKADLHESVGSVRRDLEAKLGLMATKKDLELMATKKDLELMATKKDLESMATKTDLSNFDKAIRTEMADGHRKLALQIERQQNEARTSEDRLAQKMDAMNSQVKSAIDAFAGIAQNSERAMTLHGRELTDVHVGLKDHERRIAALETRPGGM